MSPRTRNRSLGRAAVVLACTAALALNGSAASAGGPQRQDGTAAVHLEQLDRGLVAVSTTEGVFLSWRLRGNEVTGRTPAGLTGPDFHVYRDGQRVATVADSTNHLDRVGTGASKYQIAGVVGGAEVDLSAEVSP